MFQGTGKRATGTFNNPNQLGYWALVVMACLAVVKERSPLGLLDCLALGAGFFIVMLSLSKAASISGMLLILLIVAFCRCQRGVGFLLMVALALGLSYQIAAGGLVERFMSFEAVANLNQRLSGIGRSDDDDLMHRATSASSRTRSTSRLVRARGHSTGLPRTARVTTKSFTQRSARS